MILFPVLEIKQTLGRRFGRGMFWKGLRCDFRWGWGWERRGDGLVDDVSGWLALFV